MCSFVVMVIYTKLELPVCCGGWAFSSWLLLSKNHRNSNKTLYLENTQHQCGLGGIFLLMSWDTVLHNIALDQ